MVKRIFGVLLISLFQLAAFAQTDAKGWHLKDYKTDGIYGISLEKAYETLKGKKGKPVIVAVIDSGIDTAHEDLKPVLWVNPREIPGNGKDDDGNGYVDDIHGWNFLGNKDGSNLKKEVDERTRVYYRYKPKYSGRVIREDSLSAEERAQYRMWKKAASEMNGNPEEQVEVMFVEVALKSIKKHDQVLREELKKEQYSAEELEQFQPQTLKGKQAKLGYLTAMKMLTFDPEEKNTSVISQLEEYVDGKKRAFEMKSTPPPDYRAQIIRDNYFDINDRFYGNGDVMGPDPLHGTHVSGIIGAVRNNNLGGDGVADNVRIMMIRAVPDGDEYDKDVALAIKYAVDNGARVINMSFGKSYSPEKKWVDEAIRYAEMKDVLIVHAAGNEAANVEEKENFPNAELLAFNKKAENFINVGASADPKIAAGKLIADFSNYGKTKVDVFAPGVKIYATKPGGNQYGFLQGTSMASPVVAGVAALIRSYYPQLSARQVKYAIEQTTIKPGDEVLVNKPGTHEKVKLSELTRTGFINAAAALELAATLKPEQPEKTTEKPAPVLKKAKTNQ